jgi:hypothetical protein
LQATPARGWLANACVVSNSSSNVSTRVTPARQNEFGDVVGGGQRGRMRPPRGAGRLRPDFTATIGFVLATRCDSHELPRIAERSRYNAMTDVAMSLSRYRSRSLPEMSALLPTDTKLEMPMPRRALSSTNERPSAPDWVMKATLPGIGSTGANVAFIRIEASVLARPMQLGPITRMPYFRAVFTSDASTARPSLPSSANPELMITMPPTCAAPHSAITPATASAGTAMIARSGGVGVSPTLA